MAGTRATGSLPFVDRTAKGAGPIDIDMPAFEGGFEDLAEFTFGGLGTEAAPALVAVVDAAAVGDFAVEVDDGFRGGAGAKPGAHAAIGVVAADGELRVVVLLPHFEAIGAAGVPAHVALHGKAAGNEVFGDLVESGDVAIGDGAIPGEEDEELDFRGSLGYLGDG